MSSRLSPWYKSEKNRQGKTTPKYDPDKDQGRGKLRGLKSSKPSAAHVKEFGYYECKDGVQTWTLQIAGKRYRVRHVMTQEERDAEVIRKWHEATGRSENRTFIGGLT